MRNLKFGLFSIGFETYWTQFEGLKIKLKSFLNTAQNRLEKSDTTVIDAGLIDLHLPGSN